MKRLILLLLISHFGFQLLAQDTPENIFHERSFWKAQPSVELVKAKIAEGHNPTEKNDFGFDAVSYGIIDKAPNETLQYLLTLEGNPVTKPTHGDITYLLWSAYKGNIEMVNHLLDLGSDIQLATSRGTNILLLTAIGGVEDKSMYDLILSKGVKIDYENASGTNVLLSLAGSDADDETLFQYLVDKGLSWDTKDDAGNGLFNYAARAGNMAIMKMCVAKGLDYTSMNEKGENALLFAAYGRKRSEVLLETFTYLDELGLDVDVVNWEGQTPLHNAVRRGSPEIIAFFVERGVNVNQIDKAGNTAFINSVWGKVENVQKLRPLIKNINQVNHDGHSALSKAVVGARKEAFNYLTAEKADITLLDAAGNDLMSLAFQNYSSRRADNLKYIIDGLVEKGLTIKTAYAGGNTLAHYAVKKNSMYLLEKAIELGVDLNLKNDLGITSLHLAAMKAHDNELIDKLLAAGA
ncbi:MAG: ankyrin repeat domain-containing protein, partial [Bacteroidota bacterium]